jgi:molybdopterin-guanine dinucleotide biosynthesis protein B
MLRELVAHLTPVDLVIVEGFKSQNHPKLEVHRSAVGKPLLYPNDPHILAIASDLEAAALPLPSARLDDLEAIADLVERLARPYPS